MQKLRYFFIALLLIGCASVQAQSLKWYTDYDEAQKMAEKENKPMLLFFTGSTWCGYCKKLVKEVFSKPEFARLAGDKYIFVDLDFPGAKPRSPTAAQQKNDRLADKYRVQNYPTVIIVNAQGKELARTGYQAGGPKKYAQHLGSLVAVLDFQANVGDETLDVEQAIEPLLTYLNELDVADEERWKVEMTLAQYLHSQGCDEQAEAYAAASLQDAPPLHRADIERFLGCLDV